MVFIECNERTVYELAQSGDSRWSLVAVQMHSTTSVSTLQAQYGRMCFRLPLEVVKSGQAWNVLEPVQKRILIPGVNRAME